MTLFEMLIGGLGTTAGNHRCMPPDEASVPGGQGCIPAVRRGAVRRQAPPPLAWGRRNRRCPAWLVPACIVVSLAAGVRPEEARAIGWKKDGIGARRRKASRARQATARTHADVRVPLQHY